MAVNVSVSQDREQNRQKFFFETQIFSREQSFEERNVGCENAHSSRGFPTTTNAWIQFNTVCGLNSLFLFSMMYTKDSQEEEQVPLTAMSFCLTPTTSFTVLKACRMINSKKQDLIFLPANVNCRT